SKGITRDTLQLKTVLETYETVRAAFPELKVDLVHGRLKSEDKAAVMKAFQNAEIQLLVATTVIEVGVDVPNATLMVIEHAERMGLSQLHQLRGRVGRGAGSSTCILLYQNPLTPTARERDRANRCGMGLRARHHGTVSTVANGSSLAHRTNREPLSKRFGDACVSGSETSRSRRTFPLRGSRPRTRARARSIPALPRRT